MAKRKRPTRRLQLRPGETPTEARVREEIAKIQLAQLKAYRASLATYNAASRGRANKDWKASSGSADAAIIPDSPLLNARSRQTVRDTWIGSSMMLAARRNIAGVGIDVVPTAKDKDGKPLLKLNKFLRDAFWRWAGDKRYCDVEGRQTFYQKQRLAVTERFTAGQHIVVWDYKPTLSRRGEVRVEKSKPVGLRLRSVEPEQLDQNITAYTDPMTGQTREVRGGVEIDWETTAAVAYHIFGRNPNDYLSKSFQSRRIPAGRVMHYFNQERVGQTIGVSKLAAVLQEIRHFDEFKQSTLFRARMEACIGLVVKQAAGSMPGQSPIQPAAASGDSRTTGSGMTEIDFTPGMAPHLQPGEEIETIMPTSPGNQYEPFTAVTLRGIGAGAGMSYDQLSRHSEGNYSAARQNMLEDWKEWEIEQDDLMGDIIFPTYELFFQFMMLEDRLEGIEGWDRDEFADDPARFMEAACIAPAKPWIDPEKEANAAKVMIDYKLSTREEIVTARGRRFIETIEQIGAERKAAEAVNVSFPEDVESRAKLAEASAKESDAEAKAAAITELDSGEQKAQIAKTWAERDKIKAETEALLRPPPPPPVVPAPTTAELAAKADKPPNYQKAELPELKSCGACRFYSAVAGRCLAYPPTAVEASYVCDAFETKPLTEGTGNKRMAPGVEDGERPMDDPRGPLLDRGIARESLAANTIPEKIIGAANRIVSLFGEKARDRGLLSIYAKPNGGLWVDTGDWLEVDYKEIKAAGGDIPVEVVNEAGPAAHEGFTKLWPAKESLQSTSDTPNVLEDAKNKTIRKHKEELAASYDSSSTQIEVPEPMRSEVLTFGQSIPDDQLYTAEDGYGREDKPHITVLYGLEDETPDAAAKLLASVGPIRVRLGATTIFAREDKPYDVVFVEVESADLVSLNAKLRTLPYKSDYPDYKPHMTLAYVKKGVGEKYKGLTDLQDRSFTVDAVTFSSKSGKRTSIPLKA